MYDLNNILKYATEVVSHNSILLVGKDKDIVYVNELFNNKAQEKINSILTDTFNNFLKKDYKNIDVIYENLDSYEDSYVLYKSDINYNKLDNTHNQYKDLYNRENYTLFHLGEVRLVPNNNSSLYFFQAERMSGKHTKQSSYIKNAAGYTIWVNDQPIDTNDIYLVIDVIWYKFYDTVDYVSNNENLEALKLLQEEKNRLKQEYESISNSELKREKRKQYRELVKNLSTIIDINKIKSSPYVEKEIINFGEDAILSFKDGTLDNSVLSSIIEKDNKEELFSDKYLDLDNFDDIEIQELSDDNLRHLSNKVDNALQVLKNENLPDEGRVVYDKLKDIKNLIQLRSSFLFAISSDNASEYLHTDNSYNNIETMEEVTKKISDINQLINTYGFWLKNTLDLKKDGITIISEKESQTLKKRINLLKQNLNALYKKQETLKVENT